MKQKIKFIISLLIVVSFNSCRTAQNSTTTNNASNQNIQNIIGAYIGTIPCADCEGIIYELQLNNDYTYINSLTYIGKSAAPIKNSGKFSLNQQMISLDKTAGSMNLLKKIDEGLLLLDKNGQVIEGSLANHYKLVPKSNNVVHSENNGMQKILMQKQKEGIDFYAIANEPSWSLEMDFDKVIRFKTANGLTFSAPAVEPVMAMDHNVKRFRSVTESGEIIIQISQGTCNDTMSDQTFPYQVTIDYKTTTEKDYTSFKGCGMYVPDFRLHNIWVIEKLNDLQVIPSDYKKNAPQIEIFVSEQKVLGSDGCNSFSGNMYNEENRLYFGPMASTMMACIANAEISSKINSVFSKNGLTYSIANNHLTIYAKNEAVMILKHID